MNKYDLFTDNLEHYMAEVFFIQNDLKKFRDIKSFKLNKPISSTKDLYQYLLDELNDLVDTIEEHIENNEEL